MSDDTDKVRDVSRMWKVPYRQVYTNSFRRWVSATLWCHVVYRLFGYHIRALLPESDTEPQ
jgi:hypothetical protein